MTRTFSAAGWLLPGLLAVLGGCQPGPQTNAGGAISVAVSILPEAWLVKQVGGKRIEVLTLVTPGESPHTYQPSDAQVSRLMGAVVYFRIGAPFESGPWFDAIGASGKLKIVDLRRGIEMRQVSSDTQADEGTGHGPDQQARHGHGDAGCAQQGKDPHIWLSPRLLKLQAATVAETLKELDPAHQAEYDRNLAVLQKDLDELDRALRDKLAPLRGKTFFVFHPAWGYFADDYGLRQAAIEVEGKEPSDRELTEVQRQVRQAGVKVVFVQPQISGKGARAVAEATGARVEVADPLAADLPAALLQVAQLLAEAYH